MPMDGPSPHLASLTDLVIVCCHAHYNPSTDSPLYSPERWQLKDFQGADPSTGKPSEHLTFINHIETGFRHVQDNKNSLLVFSGGPTNPTIKLSEAMSYQMALWDLHPSLLESDSDNDGGDDGKVQSDEDTADRIVLEEDSTDSYQNLLFSIIRFRKVTGHYPSHITVITHAFKAHRFLDLHANAIRWPADRIRVQGINPPFSRRELQAVTRYERKTHDDFASDPYGEGTVLKRKRMQRCWDPSLTSTIAHGLQDSEAGILHHQGPELYSGPLPW